MQITDVDVRLIDRSEDKLKAVCTITLDECFVVRDIKVVEGSGGLFVAMPSRKRSRRCGKCGNKNEVRSRFCGQCGARVPAPDKTELERLSVHSDVAHPINSECREVVHGRVLEAYRAEVQRFEDEHRPVVRELYVPAEVMTDDFAAGVGLPEDRELTGTSGDPGRATPLTAHDPGLDSSESSAPPGVDAPVRTARALAGFGDGIL